MIEKEGNSGRIDMKSMV